MNVRTLMEQRFVRIGALCGALLGGLVGQAAAQAPIRLACVGDSITFGAGVSDRTTKTYPILLGQWLGAKYEVKNFGASGSTVLKKGNLPYWKRPHFKQALAFKPDVAVFLFGANDSKHGSPNNPKIANNWQYKAEFVEDYKVLLAEFNHANPNAKFYVGLPVPAFAPNRYGIDGTVIQDEMLPMVRQVAADSGAEVIDLHSALPTQDLFHDRVHPNDAGTRKMAETVYRALTGQETPTETAVPAVPAPPAVDEPKPTAPAAATVAPPAVKENFHIYLLMGQSNMVGRDTRTMDTQVENPHLLSLNGSDQWVVAKDPLHVQVGRIAPGVGPGLSFAQEMLKANPNVTIGLVPCAVGGTLLKRWVKGGDLYEAAVKRAKIAAQTGVIEGVLWHQGESDSDSQKNAETYEARLTKMFQDLRADLGSPKLPIVVGQLGEFLTVEKHPYVNTVRAALDHIPALVPNIGEAVSTGLGHKGDELHFTAEAERTMGVRFAQAMQQLQAKNAP